MDERFSVTNGQKALIEFALLRYQAADALTGRKPFVDKLPR
jgi:hypothetical protein